LKDRPHGMGLLLRLLSLGADVSAVYFIGVALKVW
jgi:hypothetical protein